MAKLNTYQLQSQLAATLQLIGIIPGSGTSFETVRLSNEALVSFIEQYAGQDGTNGRQIELRHGTTDIEWRYSGDTAWNALIAVSDLKGAAGEQIELQTTATHIQWKYSSSVTWTDLIALSALQGTNGTNGRTMWGVTGAPSGALGENGDFANDTTASMMYGPKAGGSWGAGTSYKGAKGDTGTGLKNRGAWVTGTSYLPGDYVFSTGSATASSMWILNGESAYVSNTLPKDDLSKWVEFVAPAGANGVNGKSVEMRKTATVIQWRLVGDPDWIDLVTLADISGTNGTNGTNGNTVLSTTGVPSAGVGVNGDFANDVTNLVMYGPKSAGAWPAGVSYKGGAGNDGAAGSKWLVGAGVPAAGVGANGDFYLRDTGDVYGPKAAGAWGAVSASIKGVKGDTGPGVPVGGTTGQVLAKISGTDYATQWVTPASGGGTSLPAGGATGQYLAKTSATDQAVSWQGPAINTTGDQSIAGKKTFTGDVSVGGQFKMPSLYTHPTAPASGSTVNISAGVGQQLIQPAADLAALTLKLPDWTDTGFDLVIYINKAITALTITGGTQGADVAGVVGTPTGSFGPGALHLRYFDSDNKWRVVSNTASATSGGGSTGGGMWLGTVTAWPLSEATIPAGSLALNGQIVDRATWPELWTLYSSQTITDAVWLANPLQRGKPSAGNGTTTFRLPDFNGKHSDGLTPAAAVLRGHGLNSAGTPGQFQIDQMQGHRHTGGFSTVGSLNLGANASYIQSVPTGDPVTDGTNGTPRVGTETRGTNVTVVWIVVGATGVSNSGTVDVTALATNVNAHTTSIAALSAQASALEYGYVSPQQAHVAGGAITLNHGLGDFPAKATLDLVCITADQGFLAGEVVPMGPGWNYSISSFTYGFTIRVTSTQLIYRNAPSGHSLISPSTGGLIAITPANWKLVFKASKK